MSASETGGRIEEAEGFIRAAAAQLAEGTAPAALASASEARHADPRQLQAHDVYGRAWLDQEWLVSHDLPLQQMFPKPGYLRIMRRDAAFQWAQRLMVSVFFALGARIMADHRS